MGLPRTEHGLWPPAGTQQLLRAALDEDPARARAAFLAWDAGAPSDPAALANADRRLLPLVQARLSAQGLEHPRLAWAEQTRKRWSDKHRVLRAVASEAVRALDAAGVPSLALKGLVLVGRYYEDPSLRPMSDVDLLVRPADVDRAVAALAPLGFLGRRVAPRLRPFLAALELERADRIEIDLHQYLIEYGAPPSAERGLWARARPLELDGVRTLGTAPEDLLLHICLAGLKFGRQINSRWVVDAAAILRRDAGSLDWDVVVREARRRGAARPLGECLGYLADSFRLPVPEEALDALARTPPRGRDRRRYRALTLRPATIGEVLDQHRSLYEFGAEAAGLARGPLAFAEFTARHLVHWWRVDSLASVPGEVVRRLLRLVAPRMIGAAADPSAKGPRAHVPPLTDRSRRPKRSAGH